jgi:tripartite-type tricarboxylate transporter receptor subunit TctC
MERTRFSEVAIALSVLMFGMGAGPASGQEYPNKPIRIFTSAAGGGTDFTARVVAQGLSALGQSVIVENRSPVLSGELVSKAPPDGYSLIVAANAFWIGSLLQNVPYDPLRDFSAISLATRSPSILVVHPSLPVKSVKELIALAKSRPGELNYGASTIGSSNHLSVELFKSMAGVNIVHVNYKGGNVMINGLLGGEVQLLIASGSALMPYATAGRLKALAVTSPQPSALAPGLPTIAASGLPGYEFVSVDGLFAPSKTPSAIINRLNQEVVRFLNTPKVKEQLFSAGSEAVGSSPEEFAAAVKAEMTRLGKLVKTLGLKVD